MATQTHNLLRNYDAFISYAHDSHAEVVSEMHRRLERFGKPWWKARELQVYRDRTAMGAGPDLWNTIVDAMTASGWMIVIASPSARESAWVNREIAWWVARKPARPPILALVEGELIWSSSDDSWEPVQSTALPRALSNTYTAEPFWVDLRGDRGRGDNLDDAVASIAATIRNIPKDRMIGRHLQQQRRTRRHIGAAGTVGVVLLVAALIATLLLNRQTQATTAGLLTAASGNHLSTDLGLAQLLAAEAYRLQPNAQTTAALFRAVNATPQITSYHPVGGQITALAAAGAVPALVAATDAREVVRWVSGHRETVAQLDEPATSAGISDDGDVISIVTNSGATLWSPGRMFAVDIPEGYETGPSAVSPSGRTAFFHISSSDTSDGFRGRLITIDTQQLTTRTAPSDGLFSGMYATSDTDVALYGSGGHWERRSGDTVTVAGMTQVGNHSQAEALSPSGGHFTFSNGSEEIPVWTAGAGDVEMQPYRSALVPGSSRDALALSPDGTQLAVSDGGTVYVASVSDNPQPATSATKLPGNQRITLLRFVGAHRLVGAAGDRIVSFDLSRTSRLATIHTGIELPWPCNACSAIRLAMRPDGDALSVVGGQTTALVLDLTTPDLAPITIRSGGPVSNYTQALWTADNNQLILTLDQGYGPSETEVLTAGERRLRRWDEAREARLGLSRAPDGLIYDVDLHGEVLVRDPTTGQVRSTIPGPRDLRPDETETAVPIASIDPDRGRAAVIQAGQLRLQDLATGNTRTLLNTGATDAAFAGPHLLVRRDDGMLEIREAPSFDILTEYPANPAVDPRSRPTGNGALLAQVMVDNRVSLTDALTGIEIGSLPFGPRQEGRMAAAAFTPDGTKLILAAPGPDGEVQMWDVSPQRWIATACATAGRDLSAEEWTLATRTSPPSDLRCTR